MTEYWFRPRAYGYGATPSSWKGWAAVALYVAAVLALIVPLLAWPADLPAGPAAWQVTTAMGMIAVLTVGFIRLCRARTDGEWRWRWRGRINGPAGQ
jgi:hypothetical protein